MKFKIIKYAKGEVLEKLITEFSQRDPNDIDDAIGEVVFDFLSKEKDFTSEKEFKKWLYKAAKHKLINWLKREKIISKTYLNDLICDGYSYREYSEKSNVIEKEELCEKMRKIIETLAPKKQELLELHYNQNISFVQIAKILGCTPESLRKKHERIKQEIREIMDIPPRKKRSKNK